MKTIDINNVVVYQMRDNSTRVLYFRATLSIFLKQAEFIVNNEQNIIARWKYKKLKSVNH